MLSLPEPDAIRLRHMLDAAREALSFVKGVSERSFGGDRRLVLSLVKEVEIIGEAAGRVSPAARQQLQDIPWQKIVGMRNHLIHAYFDVDLNLLWDTITIDLPPLVSALEAALRDSR